MHQEGPRSSRQIAPDPAGRVPLLRFSRANSSRATAGSRSSRSTEASPQAGYYSATTHYLDAIKTAGTDQAEKVMATLKASPADDALFGKGYIRADGRKMHDMYLFEVKTPEESKGPYDYYKLVRTIPGDEAFRPMEKGDCPLVKKG
jgi:branched-chain amino acid transport system substrate-binding protein